MNLPKIHPLGVNIIVGTSFARLATTMSMPFLAILLTTQKGVSPSVTEIKELNSAEQHHLKELFI
ncbi:hypothetical protein ACFQZ1_25395 [Bacillus sp. CGMCC 1.60114]|uniref:hypothetical protein n=1 Tax=unclassified Bacillus (in: firmicutes) TaxID=185979 RepID=UPI0036420E3D